MSELLIEILDEQDIDYTPIRLGRSLTTGQPVEWDFGHASHPSLLIVGRSGTGKTHAIKRIVRALLARGLNVHVIDSHGDIEVDGLATIPYGYASPYGINLFSVDPHPEFGGPRATISQVANLLQRLHRAMGQMQVAMFTHMAERLYQSRGFDMRNPDTWHQKPFTLADMIEAIEAELIAHQTGISADAAVELIRLAERMRKLGEQLEALPDCDERAHAEQEMQKASDRWREIMNSISEDDFARVIERIRSGFSFRGMQSLLLLLRHIAASGAFDGQEPSPDAKRGMRHLVRGLETDHQILLVDALLRRIFGHVARHCSRLNAGVTTYIVIDEVKLFAQGAFRDPMHILNRLQTEARKYGIGVILAAQSIRHMPADVLETFATSIVMPLSPAAMRETARAFQLDEGALHRLRARKDGFVITEKRREPVLLWS